MYKPRQISTSMMKSKKTPRCLQHWLLDQRTLCFFFFGATIAAVISFVDYTDDSFRTVSQERS